MTSAAHLAGLQLVLGLNQGGDAFLQRRREKLSHCKSG